MIYIVLAVTGAYLLGSIPTAFIFAKVLKGIDIREHGSGNVGATNAFRALGKGVGLTVFGIDLLKGFAAVTVIPIVLRGMFPSSAEIISGSYLVILLGTCAIAGHIWTIFLRFKGGKGVSTTAGVMAGVAPGIFLGCLLVWGVVFAISKYVSLASIAAAVSLPVLAVITGKELNFVLFCSVLCMVGVYAHRSNIKRLLKGTERRIS